MGGEIGVGGSGEGYGMGGRCGMGVRGMEMGVVV